ncbi:MAG: type II toxin-antitoxin system VapC family toxin [Anaerolineales bacterium]
MNILSDSSAWLAIYDRRDKYHSDASRAFRSLTDQKVVFFVTDLIWIETVTLLLYRAGHAKAILCGDWLRRSSRVRFVRVDATQWDEAWGIFKEYDDKDYSFADCASSIVMRQHQLYDVFTFDHHFEQMGFRRWPR